MDEPSKEVLLAAGYLTKALLLIEEQGYRVKSMAIDWESGEPLVSYQLDKIERH